MKRKPAAIDLYCGLGGWTNGLLAEGWDVIGFDIERHAYGDHRYPAQLVLQDIRTIHGAQFRNASLIVASPPCTEFSYMAMPWKRAKQIAGALYARQLCGDGPPFPDGYTGSRTVSELTGLFDACFRIQREAIEAAGHHIPLVVENVRGAQPWVGRSRWAYGSYHLFGDIPALMPITFKGRKVKMASWRHPSDPRHVPGQGFNTIADRQGRELVDGVKIGGSAGDDWFTHHNRPEFEDRATKNSGGSWFNVAHNTESGKGRNLDGRNLPSVCPKCCAAAIERGLVSGGEVCDGCAFGDDGVKQGGDWFNADALDRDGQQAIARRSGSKSSARKAASARIAMIPLPLARHIARAYHPDRATA